MHSIHSIHIALKLKMSHLPVRKISDRQSNNPSQASKQLNLRVRKIKSMEIMSSVSEKL